MMKGIEDIDGRSPNEAAKRAGGLDDLDRAVLGELTRNPFAANRAVAEALGIAASTVTSRLRSLDRRKVSRVIAVLDLARLGQSFCFIQLNVVGRAVSDVAQTIAGLPQTLMVSDLSGGHFDLLVLLRFSDTVSLNTLLYGELARIPGIRRWQIDVVVDVPVFRPEYVTFTDHGFVDDIADSVSRLKIDFVGGPFDDLDILLIAHLQQNAHQSINDVARKAGVNASTARYRLNNMESSGLLRFLRIVDHFAVGINAFALVELGIDVQRIGDIVATLHDRSWLPQLFVCAGRSSILGIVIASDEAEIIRIRRQELATIAGIDEIRISPIHRTHRIDFRWAQQTA